MCYIYKRINFKFYLLRYRRSESARGWISRDVWLCSRRLRNRGMNEVPEVCEEFDLEFFGFLDPGWIQKFGNSRNRILWSDSQNLHHEISTNKERSDDRPQAGHRFANPANFSKSWIFFRNPGFSPRIQDQGLDSRNRGSARRSSRILQDVREVLFAGFRSAMQSIGVTERRSAAQY